MYNRISVWLDEFAPDKGAFAHASDWASRLHVPLHAVAVSVPFTAADPLSFRTLQACGAECTRKGVAWETEFLTEAEDKHVAGFFRSAELSAFGADLPVSLRNWLLQESLRSPKASVMVCSGIWRPFARVLILYQSKGTDVGFLNRVIPLCRALQVPPVVLTVARTERQATERQELAREVFCTSGLEVDFDLIAGCKVSTAVAWAAQARGCSYVIVERAIASSWWHWLRRDTAWHLLNLTDKFTLLALPGSNSSEGSTDSRCGQN